MRGQCSGRVRFHGFVDKMGPRKNMDLGPACVYRHSSLVRSILINCSFPLLHAWVFPLAKKERRGKRERNNFAEVKYDRVDPLLPLPNSLPLKYETSFGLGPSICKRREVKRRQGRLFPLLTTSPKITNLRQMQNSLPHSPSPPSPGRRGKVRSLLIPVEMNNPGCCWDRTPRMVNTPRLRVLEYSKHGKDSTCASLTSA